MSEEGINLVHATSEEVVSPNGQLGSEEDRIFQDERANDAFWSLFDTADGGFHPQRDAARYATARADLMTLGYSEETARFFLNENLDCCE